MTLGHCCPSIASFSSSSYSSSSCCSCYSSAWQAGFSSFFTILVKLNAVYAIITILRRLHTLINISQTRYALPSSYSHFKDSKHPPSCYPIHSWLLFLSSIFIQRFSNRLCMHPLAKGLQFFFRHFAKRNHLCSILAKYLLVKALFIIRNQQTCAHIYTESVEREENWLL